MPNKTTTINKTVAKLAIFVMGVWVGVLLMFFYAKPSDDVLYEWKNQGNTFVLTVSDGGVDFGRLPFGDHHNFKLTKFVNGNSISYGHFITVDDTFKDYPALQVEWLEDGCLITQKYGQKLFVPYPKGGR